MSTNQNDFVIDNGTGFAVRTDIQDALQALAGNSSGNTEPSVKYAYQWWADSNDNVMKLRNSANDGWIELFQLDGTLTLEDGSNSAPALAFRDDLDTGIYSSAANTFNVATAGVERMELGATTIFNEDGADVDFRIEGDSQANLFYVDAGNDRVGIATASPNTTLDVNGDITITDKIIHGGDTNTAIRFPSNDVVSFETAGNEVMRIINPARVGIGTNNPLYPLHVKGLVDVSSPSDFGVMMGLSANDDYAQIQMNGDTGAFIDFSTSGVDQKGRILYVHANERFEFFVNSGKRMQLTGDGLILNGTDTAAENALDDYEEGSWTPVYNNVTAPTFDVQTGRYTKVGRFVYCTGRLSVQGGTALDTSDGSGMNIGGLPFTGNSDHKACLLTLGRFLSIFQDGGAGVNTCRFNGDTIMLMTSNGNEVTYTECNAFGDNTFAFAFQL